MGSTPLTEGGCLIERRIGKLVMRVLVTGGAGFIGSHVVEYYHEKAEVIVLDNFRTGSRENLDGFNCSLIEGSITNTDDVEAAMKGVDHVVHLAALISVPESIEKQDECQLINVQGMRNVLEAAASHGVKKLIHASSAAVYGDNPEVPKVETMEPAPKSPYAATKLKGEEMAEEFHRSGKLNTCSLRFFNVFGPRQDPDSAYAAAVPIFIKRALANEPITIFGDGEQTRDFIYIKDLIKAIDHCCMRPEMHNAYNVGLGKSTSIRDLANMIIRVCNSSSTIAYRGYRAGDIKHSIATVDSLKQTGYTADHLIITGLEETIASILS